MARNNLLKRAFRNNFIRKSVNDLKTMGTDKAQRKPRHASAFDLRAQYEAAPVLPNPSTSTADFPAYVDEEFMVQQESTAKLPALPVSALNLPETAQPNQLRRESGVSEWLQTVTKGDAMHMSSSEIRRHMEMYDTEKKAKVQSAYFLKGHDQMVIDYHDLVITAEEMTVSHLDTIDTTLAILEAMDGLSPHAEALRREMMEKKQMCENTLIDLLPVRSKLEGANTRKGYA